MEEQKKTEQSKDLAMHNEIIAESELVNGESSIFIDGIGDVIVTMPTSNDEMKVSLFYKKLYSKLLTGGDLLTKKGLSKILRKSGDWSDEDEKELASLTEERDKAQSRFENENSKKKKAFFQEELKKTSSLLIKKKSEFNAIMSNTVEGQAELEAGLYKVYLCTHTADGENALLCESFDEFKTKYKNEAINMLLFRANSFWMGVDESFFAEWLGELTGL